MNKEQLLSTLNSFRDTLDKPDLMIVGSLSLYLNGFNVEVSDIDLELRNPSNKVLEKLYLLRISNPVDYPNYSKNNERIDFKYQGISFNVWIKRDKSLDEVDISMLTDTKLERRYTWYNYIKVSNVISTIKAMKEQNRGKDYKKTLELIQQITNC